MVPNTSELLPEPETPVNTVSRRFGISTVTSFRLLTRAPCTRITSWWSAPRSVGVARVLASVIGASWRATGAGGSAQLLDADQVAGGVAHRAVADAVGLVGRLLDDVGVPRLQPLERVIEVLRREQQGGVGTLRHHLRDGAALVVRDAGAGGRRVEDDVRLGLALRADRDPVHAVVADVVADLEPERVAVERDGGLGVVLRQEAGVDGDAHGRDATD